ncbi:Cation-chloride cotransporter 1 (OsCCC1) (Potassium-chloride cotransporter 1) [Durusdinium trenchii]|uniref:Cation-chloride cotransporter 1 (OsCCC1) (Potassium-chloride cotransporter 1) n=1 Tax=Durusdinium trenchii TaxID=1381693 RepID=A0ABP0HUP7_9DINO
MGVKGRSSRLVYQKSFYEQAEDGLPAWQVKAQLSSELAADGGASGELDEARTFGTMFGVYLPCLQNILGVILFLRLPWIVAQAGMVYTTLVIAICVFSTILTTLSMSALATNGEIKAGGPYAILLQNLGPEFAGSVGILFYLGTTIAGTMYALGGVEALFTMFLDGKELFAFDRQLIAIFWTASQGLVVFAGMKWVAKVASVFLVIVISAVFFMSLGAMLFAGDAWSPDGVEPASSVTENMWDNYEEDPETGTTPSFTSLIALFYPSVTGIMAGSNRSGVLLSPGRSIPKGTLGAIVTTTAIYIFTVWLFGMTVSNQTLKNDKLVAATIAWPHEYVVAVGIIMSTVGAGLQSLAGAPQLLKSIANDGHLPALRVFGTDRPSDEPRRAVIFTTTIAALTCSAGNLDYITPIITMFFLSMYGAINFACFLSGFLKSPGFRPTWRYFHWGTALVGFLACTTLMFVISVLYAFVAIFLVLGVFWYIRSNRDKKEWGDALFGLRLAQAMDALLDLSDISRDKMNKARRRRRKQRRPKRLSGVPKTLSWMAESFGRKQNPDGNSPEADLEAQTGPSTVVAKPLTGDRDDTDSSSSDEEDDNDSNASWDDNELEQEAFCEQSGGLMKEKNWRPQILVLCKLRPKKGSKPLRSRMTVTQPSLLRLASQMKKGRGLTIVNSVLHGDVMDGDSKVRCAQAQHVLAKELVKHDVRGFTDVILGTGPNLLEPLRVIFQSKGLGMLSPNTVMLAWPRVWREDLKDTAGYTGTMLPGGPLGHREAYVRLLKDAIGCQKALIVTKGEKQFPVHPLSRGTTIDVWWLLHDGDMLVLLPFLLQRHKVWANCELRIFAIADDLVDFSVSSQRLQKHLDHLRITAEIKMIHVGASHARDVDQNRTVLIRGPYNKKAPDANSILSSDMFQPLVANSPQAVAPTTGPVATHLGDEPQDGAPGTASQANTPGKRTSTFLRSLSRRNSADGRRSSLDGRKSSDAATVPQKLTGEQETKVAEIAQHIKNSSGQDTQRWIQNKYAPGGAAPSPSLQSLFAQPMEGIGENVHEEEEEEELILEHDSSIAADEGVELQEASARGSTVAQVQTPLRDTNGDLEHPYEPEKLMSHQYRERLLEQKATDTVRLTKRLATAEYLNKKIRENSSGASLVVVNLMLSRTTPTDEFVKYTDQLTDGLARVIMLRGAGTEAVHSL